MEAVFTVSVAFVLYTYLVYPAIIFVWGTFFGDRVAKRYMRPPVSIVLSVRDEEEHIQERLENLLAQDYDGGGLEVIVVSDGCVDRTVELANDLGDERIRVLDTGEPVGKAAALNLGVESASHEFIVFADARQKFSENAIAELTAMFSDESVGAVSGELVIRRAHASAVGEGVGLYWEYEKLIRRMESNAKSVVGATGSIYAIRKKLFRPLPAGTLLDDFLVPMRIVLDGYRVIFVRTAKAFDWASETTQKEFTRKVRTLAGNFQAFALEPALLDPRRNPIFFQMVSHKIARLLVPYFCLLALVSNLFLGGMFYHGTLALQVLFYSAVLLRFTPLASAPFGGIIRVAWTFTVLNAAAVVGLWVFATGRDKKVWKKGRT